MLLDQMVNPALVVEHLFDLLPERRVALRFLHDIQDLPKGGEQGLFGCLMLLAQLRQAILGGSVHAADAVEKHLDQFIAAAHFGLTNQAQQHGVTFVALADIDEIADLERGGFCRELPPFGMGS
ncbi:hypothetical protein [Agrobacterium sp.]|uniref:hypothetical protein n=1 Tax=Agrobacterium sp. TaxID=361 RepID=UPI0040343487